MRTACLALLLAAIFAGTPAFAATPLFVDATPQDNFKLYWLIKAETPLTIDGRLDEDVWAKAKPLKDWGITNYGRQKGKLGNIDFRAVWDDTYLYIGARMYHKRETKDMVELRKQMGNITAPIYARECVEIHIDGNLDHATRFQSIVNGLGEKMMIWFYDFGWGILKNIDYGLDADWDVAGRIEEDHWTLEVRYALADIQVKPEVGYQFGMNPCWFNWADSRENADNYWWQYLTWSTHGDSHHDPRLFGRFVLVNEEPEDLEAGLRLAFPDLDTRTIMIQTDQGYLVLKHGEKTLQPYDDKVRLEARETRESWDRVAALLADDEDPKSAHLRKTILPEQDDALKEVEAKLAQDGPLSRSDIAASRATLGGIAEALDNAYWTAKQLHMLRDLVAP